MVYPIYAYGCPVLRAKAVDIEKGSIDVKKLAEDMFETMYAAGGVGLAAPQIGMGIRIFVVDAEALDEQNLKGFKKVFINAQILEENGNEMNYEEGCLSIPGIHEDVVRLDTLRIRYCDENWNAYEETFSGLAARVIQHEYDHIEGVLFIDHINAFKRRILKNKLVQISKGKVSAKYRMSFPK